MLSLERLELRRQADLRLHWHRAQAEQQKVRLRWLQVQAERSPQAGAPAREPEILQMTLDSDLKLEVKASNEFVKQGDDEEGHHEARPTGSGDKRKGRGRGRGGDGAEQ
jgi:hypothetical protein